MPRLFASPVLLACAMVGSLIAGCQTAPTPVPDHFADIPGHDRYQQVQRQMRTLRAAGRISDIHWSEDGANLWFTRDDDRYRFDLVAHELSEAADDEAADAEPDREQRRRPPRGRQREREPSPDGKWIAHAEDWNVVLREVTDDDEDEGIVVHVTTDGERKHRFGKASWVYGEELRQIDAMWWSPDSSMLAYYEFDERDVPDYYLTGGNTQTCAPNCSSRAIPRPAIRTPLPSCGSTTLNPVNEPRSMSMRRTAKSGTSTASAFLPMAAS